MTNYNNENICCFIVDRQVIKHVTMVHILYMYARRLSVKFCIFKLVEFKSWFHILSVNKEQIGKKIIKE